MQERTEVVVLKSAPLIMRKFETLKALEGERGGENPQRPEKQQRPIGLTKLDQQNSLK